MDDVKGTLAEQVVQRLGAQKPWDDDELARVLGKNRVSINQVARKLTQRGIIRRDIGRDGKIVNTLVPGMELPVKIVLPGRADFISEDDVKTAVATHLKGRGYAVSVMWGRERGIDINAVGPQGRLVIEAKGQAPNGPQQVNYFLNALGELVQRMDDPDARYGLALPDNAQFQGLVRRLPRLARERLRLVVYLVDRDGRVEEV